MYTYLAKTFSIKNLQDTYAYFGIMLCPLQDTYKQILLNFK